MFIRRTYLQIKRKFGIILDNYTLAIYYYPSKSFFNYPNSNNRRHNYCKLENDGSSYCFSSKPGVGKEKCHPLCLDISQQTEIQSSCNRTQSGRTCQRWDRNRPHVPNIQPTVTFHNHCAKPDGDDQHWCYTTDPNVRWEYCHPKCEVITTTSTTTTATTTTTTTTTTPKPYPITSTLLNGPTGPNGVHHITPPVYDQCGTQTSFDGKFKMSSYRTNGDCITRCLKSSARSVSPTRWMNSRREKIYYADANAESFDFPWFVRVGTEYSSTFNYRTLLLLHNYILLLHLRLNIQLKEVTAQDQLSRTASS